MNKRPVPSSKGLDLSVIIFIGLLGCALQTVQAQTNFGVTASAQTAAKPIMHSRVFQWSDLKVEPTRIGGLRGVFDAPTATLDRFSCHITTLDPGNAPHP